MSQTEANSIPKTLNNKIIGNEFMGDLWDNQSAMKQSVTLTASTDFLAIESIEIGTTTTLEVPATSSLEVSAYYNRNSSIPAQQISNSCMFRVYLTTATNMAASFTVAPFDTKDYDVSNNVDVVVNKGRFTAQTPGYYHFDGYVHTSQGSGAHRVICALYKNGSQVSLGTDLSTVGGTAGFFNGSHVGDTLKLVAGDFVEVQVLADTTIAYDVGSPSATNHFSGFFVSK